MKLPALLYQFSLVLFLQINFINSYSQNVGVGIATPQHPLDVNGAVNNNVEYRLMGKPVLRIAILNAGRYQNLYAGDSAGTQNSTGYENTFIGSQSGASNTTGYENTSVGFQSFYLNTTGIYNTTSGYQSLYSNTNGSYNTAFGAHALWLNTTGYENVALGASSLLDNTTGYANTAVGRQALLSNTTGHSNVAVGKGALSFNATQSNLVAIGDSALYANGNGVLGGIQATQNTAVGSKSLFSNGIGNSNTAVGFNSLYSNNAPENTAVGSRSLYFNTMGQRNTGVGVDALLNNTNGLENAAFGYQSLMSSTTGDGNTAAGSIALNSNTGGNQNTAFGIAALYSNTIGSDNVAVGPNAGRSNTNGSMNVFIGYNAGRNARSSNKLYISNSLADSTQALIYGDFSGDSLVFNAKTINDGDLKIVNNNSLEFGYGVGGKEINAGKIGYAIFNANTLDIVGGGTTNANRKVYVFAEGGTTFNGCVSATNITCPSDIRLKRDILPLKNALQTINSLSGYNYYWKNEMMGTGLQTGVIAQELQRVAPNLVQRDDKDELSVNYNGLIPYLIEAIKEQQKQIELLEKKIERLSKK